MILDSTELDSKIVLDVIETSKEFIVINNESQYSWVIVLSFRIDFQPL